ncbi:hypothetical protein Calla_1873 [Caldicellulosiruptor acetigenus 6A]|uniref:Uncharacterized protein n=1 Tax=Caldicellulosiruptor acetigenus 6A TaxID=632516 RepID=G2PUI0_9FIRM|nr:hypothetical protein Calla_1873 [Caldicellulosiruptor acetigenus 6A]
MRISKVDGASKGFCYNRPLIFLKKNVKILGRYKKENKLITVCKYTTIYYKINSQG